jgi:hypothetical protein
MFEKKEKTGRKKHALGNLVSEIFQEGMSL